MARFKPYRVNEIMLFPNAVNDYVPEGHLARVVDRVVRAENSFFSQKTEFSHPNDSPGANHLEFSVSLLNVSQALLLGE